MKRIGIVVLCVLLCIVVLSACGQTPQVPDESVLPDASVSTTENTTTTEETTTTTSAESTTITTTTTTTTAESTTSTTTTSKPTTTTTTTTTRKPQSTFTHNHTTRSTVKNTGPKTSWTTIVPPCPPQTTIGRDDMFTRTTTSTTTSTSTTGNAAGTEVSPPASFSFNWKGEEVLLTFECTRKAYSTLSEEYKTGWTFVSKDEKDIEMNWRYCGTTKNGKKITCEVLPTSRELLRIWQSGNDEGAGADDKDAVLNRVFEELHNMGYTYTKEEIFVSTSPMSKGNHDGYFAYASAHNETDGGLYMMVFWTNDHGWQIVSMVLDVNNRYRKPNWNI